MVMRADFSLWDIVSCLSKLENAGMYGHEPARCGAMYYRLIAAPPYAGGEGPDDRGPGAIPSSRVASFHDV
jgi:hypothetical protein